MKLEKLLPLPQAAQRLGLTLDALTRLVDSGTIKANVHQGEILVPESQVKQTITREQFERLRGTPITMAEASKKYEVSVRTIRNWAKRDHLIEILDDSYPTKLDESGVAYCVAVYKARGKSSRIFDKAGLPYQLKHPGLADYRRRKAKETQRARA
jgi:predicted site-specific integrase-resolvase